MSVPIRSLCCIHCSLDGIFTRMGIRVHRVNPPEGLLNLPELLATLPERPDAVIHQEHLGKRVVLTGLEQVPCPTLYWALDTHLNRYWQRHYSRLFAATACTQKNLCPSLGPHGRPAAWITWYGGQRPFTPHAARRNTLGFVGRLTPQRRRRGWFADHLARFDLHLVQDRFGEALADFYDDTRIAPNECIAGEINLRLFEAASSGCLPVAEKTPDGTETLFVPDQEALYYDDVLELDERLRFALAHPAITERMGHAAQAAIAARHLPQHRADALLALAAGADTPPSGPEAAAALGMTLYQLRRSGRLPLPAATVWHHLDAAPAREDIVAAKIQMALTQGNQSAVSALTAACLSEPNLTGSPGVATACCLAACRLGDLDTAKRIYVAHAGSLGRREVPRLDTDYDYLLYFAGRLEQAGFVAEPGMPFDPAVHLPENAAQALIAAMSLRPAAEEPKRRLEELMRRLPGTEAQRLGLLSDLTLRRPDDWSLGLRLAMTNLKAFRLEAGLEEALLAAQTAARLDQTPRFTRRLSLLDPSGRLGRALGVRSPA